MSDTAENSNPLILKGDELGIIEKRKNQPIVSSLKMAPKLGLDHKGFLKIIRRELADEINEGKLSPISYTDSRGRKQPMYILTESQSLIVLHGINTDEARALHRNLVDGYQYFRNLAYEDRAKRDTAKLLTDAVVEYREDQGKAVEPHHFTNEQLLCNWAVTGSYKAIPEGLLTPDGLALLAKVRDINASLLRLGVERPERKAQLQAYAEKHLKKLEVDHG